MKSFRFLESPRFQEFYRFCVVGVIATVIDVIVFHIVRTFAIYQIALICGYLFSLIINYVLTILWTFKRKMSWRNVIGIIIAHLINLFVVRMNLMYIFVDNMNIYDRYAYFITLFISTITNFLIVRFVVNRSD